MTPPRPGEFLEPGDPASLRNAMVLEASESWALVVFQDPQPFAVVSHVMIGEAFFTVDMEVLAQFDDLEAAIRYWKENYT